MIEDNGPKFKITGKQAISAFHATEGSNYQYQVSIQKEHLRPARRVDSINEHCSELNEEEKQKLIAFCERWEGRMPIHLYRMLGNGRSEAEKTFAIEFINDFDQIHKEILKADEDILDKALENEPVDLSQDRLQKTFSSESTDSGMFWTFAPYIYKNLPDKSARDRLKKIFNWALLRDASREEIMGQDSNPRNLHLKGLREVYFNLGDIYYLTINPNDITHKFTDQEARRLVEEGVFD